MNRRRWSMRVCPTARVSTRSFRRLRSTARRCRSGVSASIAYDIGALVEKERCHLGHGRVSARGGARAAQRDRLRRHRLGQDHDAQLSVGVRSRRRAYRHDRGFRRTLAAAAARGAAGDPARQSRRQAAKSRSATWSRTACVCGPTGSSSARSAAPKCSTCCRRCPPAMTARSRPSTPTARANAWGGSR